MSGVQLRAGVVARATYAPFDGGAPGAEVPSICIKLNEPPDSSAAWRLRVEFRTPTGQALLGTVVSIPPNVRGSDPERVIAIAAVPGAIVWIVEATIEPGTGASDSEAVLDIGASPCCGTWGLTCVNGIPATMGESTEDRAADICAPFQDEVVVLPVTNASTPFDLVAEFAAIGRPLGRYIALVATGTDTFFLFGPAGVVANPTAIVGPTRCWFAGIGSQLHYTLRPRERFIAVLNLAGNGFLRIAPASGGA